MKKLLIALAFLLGLPGAALASNCSTYPYTLTNGQVADATQVMANFNSILSCANSSLAHNAANSDITSLSGLSTPLSIAQGGTGNTSGAAVSATTATTATTLATGRTIGMTGDVVWTSPTFNGSGNVTAAGAIQAGAVTTADIAANAVTNAKLAAVADNTVKGNVSGGSAAPTDLPMTSCSASTSAVIYTTDVGFGCHTITPGTGTVTTTGSPANGNLTKFSGATSIVNGDLSGDVTTSGALATTIAANAVTNAKAAQMTANTTKCNATGGTANATDCSVSTMTTLLGGTTSVTLAVGNDSRFSGLTQNGQCSYTLVIGDAGKQIYCNTAGAHTLTIPANGSVAFAVGDKQEIVNDCSAGAMTIAITTDTLEWFPAGTTGSRTLAACGMATLTKITSTKWAIVGTGLT